MSVLKDISDHAGLVLTGALGFATIAKLTLDYRKKISPKPADKIKPFSDEAMTEIRSDINKRMTKLGMNSGTEDARL